MRDISWICNARTVSTQEGKWSGDRRADHDGNIKKTHTLPYQHTMMLPAFLGILSLRGIDGLVNPRGFVIVNANNVTPPFRISLPPGSA